MRTQYIQSMMQTKRSSVGATSRWGAHPPGFEPVVLQKKNPHLSHVQSTCMIRPTHKATDPVYGWEQGFGNFLNTMPWGRSFSPQVEFFFIQSMIKILPRIMFGPPNTNFS